MIRLTNTVLVIILLAVGTFVPAGSASVGDPAPDFALATLGNEEIKLEDFKDHFAKLME